MRFLKISDLPVGELTSDTIDNCLFVENLNTNEMKSVSMKKVFEWIRKTAIEQGLTVKLTAEGKILFITGVEEQI